MLTKHTSNQTADAGQNSAKKWKIYAQVNADFSGWLIREAGANGASERIICRSIKLHRDAALIASAPDLLAERDALQAANDKLVALVGSYREAQRADMHTIGTLQADNEQLREALKACHDCLFENLATPDTVEGRRGIIAINQARTALSTGDAK